MFKNGERLQSHKLFFLNDFDLCNMCHTHTDLYIYMCVESRNKAWLKSSSGFHLCCGFFNCCPAGVTHAAHGVGSKKFWPFVFLWLAVSHDRPILVGVTIQFWWAKNIIFAVAVWCIIPRFCDSPKTAKALFYRVSRHGCPAVSVMAEETAQMTRWSSQRLPLKNELLSTRNGSHCLMFIHFHHLVILVQSKVAISSPRRPRQYILEYFRLL